MTKGRLVGAHIKEICTVLEEIGPATCRDLIDHFPEIKYANMFTYCARAVGLGLLSVNRKDKQPNIFTISPVWRAVAAKHKTTKPMAAVVKKSRWQGVNSVFQMHA